MTNTFNRWLASYLILDKDQTAKLLKDKTATNFLMTWSIFESDCFNGYFGNNGINDFSQKIIANSRFKREKFKDHLKYFHSRYQDPKLVKNLIHKQKLEEIKKILEKNLNELTPSEEIFFLVFVVYRYRNNIFHGNKGVYSWMKFSKQIDRCRKIMQELIDITDTAHKKRQKYSSEKRGLTYPS